jgi:hypothetical protein
MGDLRSLKRKFHALAVGSEDKENLNWRGKENRARLSSGGSWSLTPGWSSFLASFSLKNFQLRVISGTSEELCRQTVFQHLHFESNLGSPLEVPIPSECWSLKLGSSTWSLYSSYFKVKQWDEKWKVNCSKAQRIATDFLWWPSNILSFVLPKWN